VVAVADLARRRAAAYRAVGLREIAEVFGAFPAKPGAHDRDGESNGTALPIA
jgi:hypothetical protein